MIEITKQGDGFVASGTVKFTGNRVNALIKHNTHDKINKLETIPFTINNNTIQTILDNSNFIKLRRKLGKVLSEEGKAGVLAIPHMDSYILDVMKISDYTQIGNYLSYMTGTTGASIEIDGTDYTITTKIWMENNKPYIESFVIVPGEKDGTVFKEVIRDKMAYKCDVLPAEFFSNNENNESDIAYADVLEDLRRLEYLDSQYMEQWELSAAMTSFNTNWTDNDPADENIALRNGRGYTAERGHKAKLREGSGIIQGNGTTVLLQNDMDYLENVIRKNLGLHMISGSDKGTNKTIIEITGKEQVATETLVAMRELRQFNWQVFFNRLAMLLGTAAPTITQEFSKIEQAKLDMLDATIASEQAKAVNKQSNVVDTTEGE